MTTFGLFKYLIPLLSLFVVLQILSANIGSAEGAPMPRIRHGHGHGNGHGHGHHKRRYFWVPNINPCGSNYIKGHDGGCYLQVRLRRSLPDNSKDAKTDPPRRIRHHHGHSKRRYFTIPNINPCGRRFIRGHDGGCYPLVRRRRSIPTENAIKDSKTENEIQWPWTN